MKKSIFYVAGFLLPFSVMAQEEDVDPVAVLKFGDTSYPPVQVDGKARYEIVDMKKDS